MDFTRIRYSDLNSRQKEIYNFQKISGLLADFGFNCIKLSDDWQGADFLAYHKDGESTLRVQLKSRLHIAQKYVAKGLYVAFPISGSWYLIEHDSLVEIIGVHTTWLETESWRTAGAYSSANPSKKVIEELAGNEVGHA